jgi:hypothetical protein
MIKFFRPFVIAASFALITPVPGVSNEFEANAEYLAHYFSPRSVFGVLNNKKVRESNLGKIFRALCGEANGQKVFFKTTLSIWPQYQAEWTEMYRDFMIRVYPKSDIENVRQIKTMAVYEKYNQYIDQDDRDWFVLESRKILKQSVNETLKTSYSYIFSEECPIFGQDRSEASN